MNNNDSTSQVHDAAGQELDAANFVHDIYLGTVYATKPATPPPKVCNGMICHYRVMKTGQDRYKIYGTITKHDPKKRGPTDSIKRKRARILRFMDSIGYDLDDLPNLREI